ncbi:restriction endonuclease [Microbacteriaceae bacterium K1510]|nr:restriction endonuclease [Microbacteriaceae bacterium K1510]
MELPRPKNWQDFEIMVRDAMVQRWKSPDLQRNGRTGQEQNGIDIYGPDDIGRRVGIQCKRYQGSLTLKIVQNEIAAAETFAGPLTTLYIATTAENDAKLQQHVRQLSDKRVAENKFSVSLIFWDDVISALALNPAVFQLHYPQVSLSTAPVAESERMLAALELGYFGGYLWEYVLLVYGEFGEMAQTDPDGLIATLRMMERRAGQLFAPDDAAPIIESLIGVRNGCLAEKKANSDWDPVEAYAKRVETRLARASSLLPASESKILELAIQLGKIYLRVDNRPAKITISQIEEKVRALLPVNSSEAITEKFASANKLPDGFTWASRIYGLLYHELRWKTF